METIDILKIILPALIVLLTAYLLIDKLLRNEEKRRNFELRKENSSTLTPIRLRAYERLILLLERTTPATLIVTIAKPEMTNRELHTQLLSSIRQEFSHNLSQQIYVSDDIWNHIRGAQESLLRLVNTCASQCNPANSASELAERIIQVYNASDQTPTELAINLLKKEVRLFF
ncbi:MAG: hypothetical protein Q8904_05375 [Bacteroidota bacterium]|nr:hypothetical protein [Bacteroidota bacterium]